MIVKRSLPRAARTTSKSVSGEGMPLFAFPKYLQEHTGRLAFPPPAYVGERRGAPSLL